MKKLLLGLVVSGCAAHLPPLHLERSQWSIRAAEELGAATDSRASLYLWRAKNEQQAARRLANVGDPRALTLLECSEADADLSLALAREAVVRREDARATAELTQQRAKAGNR
jgi:hypothetical protein